TSWTLSRGISGYRNVMRLLVRMERPQSVCAAIVLGLVVSDAVATGWDFLQRILVASYTPETLLGDTDSQRAAPFRVLAPRLLGVDRCCGCVCFSLFGCLLYQVKVVLYVSCC